MDDPRYNKQRRMIDDFVPNKGDTELALQEMKKEDVLHRKRWKYHLRVYTIRGLSVHCTRVPVYSYTENVLVENAVLPVSQCYILETNR